LGHHKHRATAKWPQERRMLDTWKLWHQQAVHALLSVLIGKEAGPWQTLIAWALLLSTNTMN
jgi:hypothetical protein